MGNNSLNKYDWIAAGITVGMGILTAAGTILTVVFNSKASNARALQQPKKQE